MPAIGRDQRRAGAREHIFGAVGARQIAERVERQLRQSYPFDGALHAIRVGGVDLPHARVVASLPMSLRHQSVTAL